MFKLNIDWTLVFKIIYFIGMILCTIVRKYYSIKFRQEKLKVDNKTVIDILLLALTGVGMLLPIVYVFIKSLDFAIYNQPIWLNWLGVVIFVLSILLLWRTHADLGNSWTLEPGIKEEHKLVTKGVYAYIRHPMYAAHIYWGVAQALILSNWLVGFSLVIPSLLLYLYRLKGEEQMMIEQFGDEYREYMKVSGRIFPKLLPKR